MAPRLILTSGCVGESIRVTRVLPTVVSIFRYDTVASLKVVCVSPLLEERSGGDCPSAPPLFDGPDEDDNPPAFACIAEVNLTFGSCDADLPEAGRARLSDDDMVATRCVHDIAREQMPCRIEPL